MQLGGRTMTRLLADAIEGGIDAHMWYMALTSIPEHEVRRRHDASRHNLLELLPGLAPDRRSIRSREPWVPAAATGPRVTMPLDPRGPRHRR
jgi:hypothetical protein